MTNNSLILNPTTTDKYGRRTFIPLDEAILIEISNNMWSFLQQLHPHLNNRLHMKEAINSSITELNEVPYVTKSDNICIELRTFKQCYPPEGVSAFDHASRYSKGDFSYKVYSFSDKEKERFTNKMKELNQRGLFFDLFYSVYYFDNSILGYYSSGKKKTSFTNTIDKDNSCCTDILVADFDHISKKEFDTYCSKFGELGILPSMTIASGHGFHAIWNIELSCDKFLLRKFTTLLLQNNFPVDCSIVDCARILRMPYWFNCKDMSDKLLVDNDQYSIPETKLLTNTGKHYTVDDIFLKLESCYNPVPLSNKSNYCQIDYLLPYDIYNKKYSPSSTLSKKAIDYLDTVYKDIVDINLLDSTICKMLLGPQRRYSDLVVFFLFLYFKERGYSTDAIKAIIQTYATLDTFSYAWSDLDVDSHISRLSKNYSNASSLAFYKSKKLNIFGPYFGYQNDAATIKIYNGLLENISSIGTMPFYIYTCMNYIFSESGQRSFTISDIASISGLSLKTIYRNIPDLVYSSKRKFGTLDKKYITRKNHRQALYYVSSISRDWSKNGYVEISLSQMATLLEYVNNKQLTPTELCTYFLLCFFSKLPGGCYVNLETLAKIMGYSSIAFISRGIEKLIKLNLVKKTTTAINKYQTKNKYTIV